jgi:hypothetical protein
VRYLEYGKFASQHPDFDFQSMGGRSILAWVSDTDQEETNGSPIYHNETTYAHTLLSNTGETNSFNRTLLVWLELAAVRGLLGQIPVLVSADLVIYGQGVQGSGDFHFQLFKMFSTWDPGDTTNRYKDKSALLTWYEDVYAPMWGQDVASSAFYDSGHIAVTAATPAQWRNFPITEQLADALADGEDLRLFIRNHGTYSALFEYGISPARYPHLAVWYLFPVEFYKAKSSGAIDLADSIADDENASLYLGAVERGETGTPTKAYLRNYSPNTINAEIFDDHPEYEDPEQTTGTGTGALDFVDLVGSAVSQLYTVVFYSGTQFEVKAEAHRDNATSLHPQINADASWRGAVGSTFTAPSGGLVIPATAWQSIGINTADEFEVKVTGNTTDTDWPNDSNEQVEIARDDGAGNADANTWRPIQGRREKTRAAVTIDATSKFIHTRRVAAADWPTGTRAFIMDATNIDEGTVDSVSEAAIASAVFSGSGLDDLTASGNYTGPASRTYVVNIDATGTPDTFKWSRDNGSTWAATGVAITGSAQELELGVVVTFAATTGHTATDYWNIAATPWGITLAGLTSGSNAYASGSRIGTTLPVRGVAAATWSTTSAAAGASETPASRVYLEDVTGFAASQTVFIMDPAAGVSELATVDTVSTGAKYLDLDATLSEDYGVGSFVTVDGTGEEPFHLRPAAKTATVEEKKRVRINARI